MLRFALYVGTRLCVLGAAPFWWFIQRYTCWCNFSLSLLRCQRFRGILGFCKGQIIIPAEIRKRYNIKRGDRLVLREVDGKIILVPLGEKPFAGLYGTLRGKTSLTLALAKEHAAEIAKEEKCPGKRNHRYSYRSRPSRSWRMSGVESACTPVLSATFTRNRRILSRFSLLLQAHRPAFSGCCIFSNVSASTT